MAKIVEDVIVIKVSKLVKKATEVAQPLVNEDILAALEAVATELVEASDPSAVVELIHAGETDSE